MMKNVAIFTDNLHVGGIQKSIVNLLRNIDHKKYNIDLYLFDRDNFYELPPNINVIYLKKPTSFHKFIFFNINKKILKLNILEKHYDVAIDFDSYQMHTALGALKANAKITAIWIHNDIPIKLKEEEKYQILHFFFKRKYQYFNTFCAVSKGALDSFKTLYYDSNKKYFVIPNYIDTNEIKEKMEEDCELVVDSSKINIVTVGRLCHQKGIDIMLNNIKKLTDYRNDFHLYLIGDGPLRKSLEEQAENLEIKDFITFLGNQKNPFKYLKKMDLFYLSSRYEGQGMVILEALAIGLDIIIPEHLEKYCPNTKGTNDIIANLKEYKKKEKKQFNDLKEYNCEITNKLEILLDGNPE